jgi:hypothetical protein
MGCSFITIQRMHSFLLIANNGEHKSLCHEKGGGEQAWHISYHVLNISRKKTQGPSHLAFLLE